MLPPIPQAQQGVPSFSLSAVSVSPAMNPTSARTELNDLQFSRSLVSPTTPTDPASAGICSGQSPNNPYAFGGTSPAHTQQLDIQDQQQVRLVNVPAAQSYSHQPTTQSSSMMLSGHSITSMTAASHQVGGSAGTHAAQGRPPRNKNKFKRFRNAFIYFVNDQRNKVDDETKKLKNREFLQLMSARWKAMPEEERRPYVCLAEEDKKRFNNDVKKFGKYESRQRRYNKSRSFDGGVANHPCNFTNTGLANTSAANYLYNGYN
ncbi:hypothetical protein EC988_006119, partial [Linderina pennispora]